MRVDDVVILKDDNIKRIFWKLAKVIELLRGSDGVARAPLINVSDESGPPKVFKGSIRHLISMEVNDEDVSNGDQASATGDTAPKTENSTMGAQSCKVDDDYYYYY